MFSNLDMPNAIAIIGGALTLILFLLKAIIHSSDTKDIDSFFFANEKLTKEGISYNLSATSTSLATALLFIILQSPQYGFIIFGVVFLFWGGQWIFLGLTKNVDPSPLYSGSIYRFLNSAFDSQPISVAVNIIAVFNYFVLILLELVLGATIFSFFFSSNPNAPLYFMVFMSIFIFLYVLIGGFETVAFSDGWQFSAPFPNLCPRSWL
jgi:Na+/proline symporter